MEFTGLFRRATTDSTYDEDATDAAGIPTTASRAHNFVNNKHSGDQDSTVANLRLIYSPHEIATFFGGVGFKDEETESWAIQNEDDSPAIPDGVIDETWRFDTEEDRRVWMYSLGTRVTPVRWLVCQVDARGERGNVCYDWVERQTLGGSGTSRRLTDADFNRDEFTTSLTVKPRRDIKLVGRWRFTNVDNDYDDDIDTRNGVPAPERYPAYIGANDRQIDELSASVRYTPCSRFWATYKSAFRETKYEVQKEPTEEIAKSDSLINSLSLNVIPTDRLTLTAFGSHQDYQVKTKAASAASTPISKYTGDAKVAGLDASYALLSNTTLSAGYSVTSAKSVFDHNFFDTYVGITHQFARHWSADARCTYTKFDEKGNGNIDEYHATMFTVGITGTFGQRDPAGSYAP